MARTKHIVSNPYHLWAHEVQDWAKNRSGNQSFENSRAYSYAAVIARIMRNAKGERAFLIANRRWSVTTSGHQSSMQSAIPQGETLFHVADVGGNYSDPDHTANVRDYWTRIADLLGKAKRARTNATYRQEEAVRTLEELRRYVAFFKVKGVKVPSAEEVETANAVLATYNRRDAKARKIAEERQAEELRKRREEAQETIAQWIAGANVQVPYIGRESYMRIKGEEVQTTHSAAVPLDHVRRAMPLVLRLIETGKPWEPNGQTVRIGHYAVSRIAKDGTVTVGCHEFAKSEVLRFAKVLETA